MTCLTGCAEYEWGQLYTLKGQAQNQQAQEQQAQKQKAEYGSLFDATHENESVVNMSLYQPDPLNSTPSHFCLVW